MSLEMPKKHWKTLDTDTVLGLREMLNESADRLQKNSGMGKVVFMLLDMYGMAVAEDVQTMQEAEGVYIEALREQIQELDSWLYERPDYGQAIAKVQQKKHERAAREKMYPKMAYDYRGDV